MGIEWRYSTMQAAWNNQTPNRDARFSDLLAVRGIC